MCIALYTVSFLRMVGVETRRELAMAFWNGDGPVIGDGATPVSQV